jgi:hypothetical protein
MHCLWETSVLQDFKSVRELTSPLNSLALSLFRKGSPPPRPKVRGAIFAILKIGKSMTKLLAVCFIAMFAGFAVQTSAQERQALRLVQTIPLPGVTGRLNHMGVDLEKKRLFVAAVANNTLEVVDLTAGKVIKSLAGFKDTQDALFLGGDFNKLYVSCMYPASMAMSGFSKARVSGWFRTSKSSLIRTAFSTIQIPISFTSATAARMQDSMPMNAWVFCSRSLARDTTSLSPT